MCRSHTGGAKTKRMQFILGVLLFVVVIGIVDAGVPWPRCRTKAGKP
jgi:hypothetical protein